MLLSAYETWKTNSEDVKKQDAFQNANEDIKIVQLKKY